MIIFNEILSTSRSRDLAFKFANNAMFVIKVQKYMKVESSKQWRHLTARNAVYIENLTDVKGEEEILFPSGSEFLIDDILLEQIEQNSKGENKKLTMIYITIPLYIKTL